MSDALHSARRIVAEATREPLDQVTDEAAVGALESWDSITHVHIMLALEEAIGRDLTPEEIADCMDVKAIAAVLETAMAVSAQAQE